MADGTIEIKKTFIGTSDPLNVCSGLALFPPFPNIGAGVHFTQNTHALLNKDLKILAFRASAAIDWGVFMGLCGPGYAIKFLTEGEIEGDELALKIDEDSTIGGFALGTNVSIDFALMAKLYKLHWKGWHLKGSWDAVLNAELAVSFDFLKLALDVILAALGLETWLQKVEPIKETLTSSIAMLGEAEDVYKDGEGVIEIHPKFMLPINLWVLVVALAAAGEATGVLTAPSTVILAFDKLMDVTCSSIGCGPTLGIDVPVKVQVDSVTIDKAEFKRTYVDSSGTWHGTTSSGDIPQEPEKMTVKLGTTAGFDFRVGVYAEVQILELFHAGVSMDTGMLALLGIQPQIGEFHQTLSNDIGSQYASGPCLDCTAQMGPVEVEFV
ncbi:hypothetical protein AAU61_07630 [Desulfocarbo indianensis]|nr:hypothetical protein AAU61_07630 [Desulfocarbo indianensis]